MAFRSTNISIGDVFRTAAAPGEALSQGIDKIGAGLAGVVKSYKDAEKKRKADADAINLLHAAQSGDVNNLFAHATNADNADLALNLAKVLMTKQAHDADLALRQAALTEKATKDKADRDFVGKHGFDLLSAIQKDLLLSPEVKASEWVPKVDPATGQPVMQDGEPVLEQRERLISPALTQENPLYRVVQQLKAEGATLTPDILRSLLKQNDDFTESAMRIARERGLNVRSGEAATRAGLRGVLDVAKEEQRQSGNLERDDARQQGRLEAIHARADEIIEQIEARGAQAQNLQEREQAFQAAQRDQDRTLRERLASLRQGGKTDLAEREKAAHIRAIRTLIERDRTDKESGGVKFKADPAGKAYWRRLGSRGDDFVSEYGATQQDENALFTYLIKQFLTDDLSGAKAIDTSTNLPRIREILDRLQKSKDSDDPKEKKAAAMVGSGDAMKRFMDFLREVDAYVDGR